MIENLEQQLTKSLSNLLKSFVTGVLGGSYWICLIACLICLILYIGGCKKAGKGVSLSLVIYITLEVIRGAFTK